MKKYREELSRFEYIPTLVEMYENPIFNEMELLHLLHNNYYIAFSNYYQKKYGTPIGDSFLNDLFSLISMFVFRAYRKEEVQDLIRLLSKKTCNNPVLRKVLARENSISTSLKSDYYKKGKNHPELIHADKDGFLINTEIFKRIEGLNAGSLLHEHIELYEYLVENYHFEKMKTFDLVTKAEFLFNLDSQDCYLNAVGERIVHDTKKVFCPIKITTKETRYANKIVASNRISYLTQDKNSKYEAEKKMKMIQNGYEFHICARFDHLGYSSTTYVNLGPLTLVSVSETLERIKDGKNKFNHELIFELENDIPKELIFYNSP